MPIPGGYILLSRRLIEHEIMKKPPLYLKVWVWLLTRAQYKPYNGLKRGQVFVSIPEIQEAMAYYAGYRKVKPSRKEIRQVLDWLRNPHEGATERSERGPMIVTTKGTHGMLIDIVNYNVYQDPSNYEGPDEGPDEIRTKVLRKVQKGPNINKKDKKDKKEYINKMSMDQVHEVQKIDLEGVQADQEDETDTEGPVHGREFEVVPSSEAVAPLSDKPTPKEEEKAKLAAEFSEWWQDYPRKDARKEAEAKYIATRRKGATKEGLERAKQNYIRYVRAQGIEKKFIMQGKTFLGPHERWRDWLNDIEVASLVVGSGMAPVPTQAAYEQERAELEQFGGDYKKWWAWKKKQLRQ